MREATIHFTYDEDSNFSLRSDERILESVIRSYEPTASNFSAAVNEVKQDAQNQDDNHS
jgi:hypothetical protein